LIRAVVVDDHAVVRTGIKLLLEREDDIDVVGEAGTAKDAVFRARALKPDVILLDVHVPVLDGLQLLAALRADEETRDILVVVCSEDDNPQLIQEAERLQAAAYLVKGRVLPSGLSQKIGEVLRHRGAFTADNRAAALQAS